MNWFRRKKQEDVTIESQKERIKALNYIVTELEIQELEKQVLRLQRRSFLDRLFTSWNAS